MKKSILILAIPIIALTSTVFAKENTRAAGIYVGANITSLKNLEYSTSLSDLCPVHEEFSDASISPAWGFEFENVVHQTSSLTHAYLIRFTYSSAKAISVIEEDSYKYFRICDENGDEIVDGGYSLMEYQAEIGFTLFNLDLIYTITPFKTRNLSFMIGADVTLMKEVSTHQTAELIQPEKGYFRERTTGGALIRLPKGLYWSDDRRSIYT